jgi:Peptidase family S41
MSRTLTRIQLYADGIVEGMDDFMQILKNWALCSVAFILAPFPALAANSCGPKVAITGNMNVPRFMDGPQISAEDIRADFEGWLVQMHALHPDISLRTDRKRFDRTVALIRNAIDRPMSQREVWLLFARLNPMLRDGHNSIAMPDRAKLMQTHLDAGGRIFPIKVHLDQDGRLRVGETGTGVQRGEEILAINGRPVAKVVEAILALAPGDTLSFRREYVARRFAALYWMQFGDTGNYVIKLRRNEGCVHTQGISGATKLAVSDQAQIPASYQYSSKILDGDIGYLRVASFDGEYKTEFALFAQQAFTQLKARGVRALIIDVRDNGGGDDPLWQENLMEYITNTPYAHVGQYKVRVNKDNADPGDIIGEVQDKVYQRRFVTTSNNPLRLNAPVFVLAGRFTYSSAIQFLVAAQDFGIAKIAGPETGAFSCQTGQIKLMDMPNTGLRAFTPVIAFVRPSGKGCNRGVIPDIVIDDDALDPERAINILAEKIRPTLG